MDVSIHWISQTALVIIALVNVLLLGGLVVSVFLILKALKQVQKQLQPIIDRTAPIMDRVPVLMDEVRPIVANVNPLINENVKPILGNVQEITGKVSGIVSDLGPHVHGIAETSEQTVKQFSERIATSGQTVAETVSRPVIRIAGIVAGVRRAFSVLKHYRKGEG